jgi:hypothetical protein
MVLIYPLHRMNGGEAALFIAGLGTAWPILTPGQEFPSIGQMVSVPDHLMALHRMWLIPTGLERGRFT